MTRPTTVSKTSRKTKMWNQTHDPSKKRCGLKPKTPKKQICRLKPMSRKTQDMDSNPRPQKQKCGLKLTSLINQDPDSNPRPCSPNPTLNKEPHPH